MAATSALKPVVSRHQAFCASSPSPSSASSSTSCEALELTVRPRLALRFPSSSRKLRCIYSSSSSCSSSNGRHLPRVYCSSGSSDVTVSEPEAPTATSTEQETDSNWLPVIPVSALPKGERRLVRQDGEDVLLLWYKSEVYAIENTSPAEGAYSEGFINARLTQDGCIVCPSTESTFDLKTGEIKEWFPKNPVLRVLTPPLRNLITYPVKVDAEYVYINTQSQPDSTAAGESAEIVFGGQVQAGKSASNIEVDEIRMVVDEGEVGFGFTPENEIINGRSAMVGFTVLLIFELITGKGFLKGIGFLDFLYRYLPDFPILKY